MRYSRNPDVHYYFLLDWPGALLGPRAFTHEYHLMEAYRNNGYYSSNIRDSRGFLVPIPISWYWTRRTQTRWMPAMTTPRTCRSQTSSM